MYMVLKAIPNCCAPEKDTSVRIQKPIIFDDPGDQICIQHVAILFIMASLSSAFLIFMSFGLLL